MNPNETRKSEKALRVAWKSWIHGHEFHNRFCSFCVHLCSSVFPLLFLSTCAVGPNYSRPEVEVPTPWKEAGDWAVAQPKDAAPNGKWGEAFNDRVLDGLMEQVSV